MSAPIDSSDSYSGEIGLHFKLKYLPEGVLGHIVELTGFSGISNLWCSGDKLLIAKLGSPHGISKLEHIEPYGRYCKHLPRMQSELKGLRTVRLLMASNGSLPALNFAWIKSLPSSIEHLDFQCQEASTCWGKPQNEFSRTTSVPNTVIVRDLFPKLVSLSNTAHWTAKTRDNTKLMTQTLFWGFPESCRAIHLPLPFQTIYSLPSSLETLTLGCLKIPKTLYAVLAELPNLQTLSLNNLVKCPKNTLKLPPSLTRLEMERFLMTDENITSFDFPMRLSELKVLSISFDLDSFQLLPPTITSLSKVDVERTETMNQIPINVSRLELELQSSTSYETMLSALSNRYLTQITLNVSMKSHDLKKILLLLPPTVIRAKLSFLRLIAPFNEILDNIPPQMTSLELESAHSISESNVSRILGISGRFPKKLQRLVVYNTIFVRIGHEKTWDSPYDAIRENRPEQLSKLIQMGVVQQQIDLLKHTIDLMELYDELVALKVCSPIVLAMRFSSPDLACLRLLLSSHCDYCDPRINLYFIAAEHARWEAFMHAATFLPKSHLFPFQYLNSSQKQPASAVKSFVEAPEYINLGSKGLVWWIIRDGATHVLEWLRNEQGVDLSKEEVITWGTPLKMAITAKKWETFAWLYTNVDDRVEVWTFAEKLASASEQEVIRVLETLQKGINKKRLASILSLDFIADMLHNANPMPILQWFVDHSIDITLKDLDYCTLAHRIPRVPESHRIEIAEWMWARQVPFDVPNAREVYPIHIWIERKQWALVKWAVSKSIPMRDPSSIKTIGALAKESGASGDLIAMIEATKFS